MRATTSLVATITLASPVVRDALYTVSRTVVFPLDTPDALEVGF